MNPRYLLDTNVLVDVQRRKRPLVLEQFASLEAGEAAISAITYGELRNGAESSADVATALQALSLVLKDMPILPLEAPEARLFGRLLTYLERRGERIGLHDLWIACHALTQGLVLVTNNEREFLKIPELKFENWAKE